MKWEKRGLVYTPDASSPWAQHSALQPTPLLLPGGERIRVYVGCRDSAGVSRVGYVEVSAKDPSQVLSVSHEPVLDVGQPGDFDDNGVVPCAVVPRQDGRVFLYYAGYSQPAKVKFHVFGGLATSEDGGRSFTRFSRVAVLDRTDDEPLFRVAHTVLWEGGRWRVWYGGGGEWVQVQGKTLPVYDVRYLESADGICFPQRGTTHVTFESDDEYRIGRPFVFRQQDGPYRMFYGVATRSHGYRLGYARSVDGNTWERDDADLGLDVSPADWDSEMVAYPSVIMAGDSTWMFYNGNDMGRGGFGCAQLVAW